MTSSSSSSSAVSIVTNLFVIVLFTFLIIGTVYVWLRYRDFRSHVPQRVAGSRSRLKQKAERYEAQSKDAVQALYVPKRVGHRTGKLRVFPTNKGLRVYDTNEWGAPVPDTPQSSS